MTDNKLPGPDFLRQLEKIHNMNQRTLKEMFRSEIRGSFLIEIESIVMEVIAPILPRLYDFSFSEEVMISGGDNYVEYEICKTIIGVHHSNTVFLTKEERSKKEKNQEYKSQLVRQVAENMALRRYSGAFFRQRTFIHGERYIYYPVPYLLFAQCTRMNELFLQKGGADASGYWISLIMNKSLAALTLLEDSFLDSAYMPCRTVIEMFVKLMLFRSLPQLYAEGARFANFDLDKTCVSLTYSDEFNEAYTNRKSRSTTNKVDFLHYGFVDAIDDYHEIVHQHPYSINGIIQYLEEKADDDTYELYERLKRFYTMCHGYIHGNVVKARFPLLHYFEISLILGEIVPRTFSILCDDLGEDKLIAGQDILSRFNNEFVLLQQQYNKRSTEYFELEQSKFS